MSLCKNRLNEEFVRALLHHYVRYEAAATTTKSAAQPRHTLCYLRPNDSESIQRCLREAQLPLQIVQKTRTEGGTFWEDLHVRVEDGAFGAAAFVAHMQNHHETLPRPLSRHIRGFSEATDRIIAAVAPPTLRCSSYVTEPSPVELESSLAEACGRGMTRGEENHDAEEEANEDKEEIERTTDEDTYTQKVRRHLRGRLVRPLFHAEVEAHLHRIRQLATSQEYVFAVVGGHRRGEPLSSSVQLLVTHRATSSEYKDRKALPTTDTPTTTTSTSSNTRSRKDGIRFAVPSARLVAEAVLSTTGEEDWDLQEAQTCTALLRRLLLGLRGCNYLAYSPSLRSLPHVLPVRCCARPVVSASEDHSWSEHFQGRDSTPTLSSEENDEEQRHERANSPTDSPLHSVYIRWSPYDSFYVRSIFLTGPLEFITLLVHRSDRMGYKLNYDGLHLKKALPPEEPEEFGSSRATSDDIREEGAEESNENDDEIEEEEDEGIQTEGNETEQCGPKRRKRRMKFAYIPIVVHSEEEVFAYLKLPYIHPINRRCVVSLEMLQSDLNYIS